MKKIFFSISATLFIAVAIVFANNTDNQTCSKDANCCVSCPCTPDCQPSDDWCTCISSCEK